MKINDNIQLLLKQSEIFKQWKEYDKDITEYDSDYLDWDEIYNIAYKIVIENKTSEADDKLLKELSYLVGCDSEDEKLIDIISQDKNWFEVFCNYVVNSEESEAKWQLADYIAKVNCNQETKDLILVLANDSDEYVSRRALLAMPNIRKDKVEEFSEIFWNKSCYDNEKQEYQRIAVLDSLYNINSPLLPTFLKKVYQVGGKYLIKKAKEIENKRYNKIKGGIKC